MTEKELLYVEDALGHEQYFQTACQNTTNQLQDGDLKNLGSLSIVGVNPKKQNKRIRQAMAEKLSHV